MTKRPSKRDRTSAWIGRGLDEQARLELQASLEHILPGSPEQRLCFLNAVDEEIDVYFKLSKPQMLKLQTSRLQLTTLSKTAKAFLSALQSAEHRAQDMLRKQMIVQTRRGSTQDDATPTVTEIEAILLSIASHVEYISTASLNSLRSFKNTTEETIVFGLVDRLAEFYVAIFGERPSAAAEGVFGRTVVAVLRAAKIERSMRQKKLTPIVNRFSTYPAPKRGPKAKTRQ